MKIGILTHPLKTNYGGLLQAFALQKVLTDMGYDVLTIDRHAKGGYKSFPHHCVNYVKRLKEYFWDKKEVSIRWNHLVSDGEYREISRHTQSFVDRNIRTTRKVYNNELKDIDKEYLFDAYVVGSDQVWLPSYCPGSFLDFVDRDNVVKLFYAASCGKQSFAVDERLKEECKKLARTFRAVAVREDFLVNLSESALERTATLVLDPTMLLRPADYLHAVSPSVNKSPVVFSYILDRDERKADIVQAVSKKLNLPVEEGNVKTYYIKSGRCDINDCVYPSVDSWINKLNRSEFVVTDSFHGVAFAILFNKPFIVIGNRERGLERFISLLKMFNLSSRLINNVECVRELMEAQIDFAPVNAKLEAMRAVSLNFLRNGLEQ